MNIKEAIKTGMNMLKEKNIEDATLKSKMIMENVLGQNRQYIIANDLKQLDYKQEKEYFLKIKKILENNPIEYITNKKEFMNLELYVNQDVLIPRQDTEILVEEVINILHNIKAENIQILDMCTGSGAIAIALAKNVEKCIVDAVDISSGALEVVKKNIVKNKVEGRVNIINSDLFSKISNKKYDLIVSNPPYIESNVIEKLDKQVQKEPILALDGGDDGLDFYKKIINEAPSHLESDGYLCFEIGYNQKNAVQNLLSNSGKYQEIYCKKDLCGNGRVIIAKKSERKEK